MASQYTGQFGTPEAGMDYVKKSVEELEALRKQAEKGEIPQEQYVSKSNELLPLLQKENHALQRVSSDFNAKYGSVASQFNQAAKNANVYQSAREILGRDITSTELAQFLPRFGTGDPKDVEVGRSYLAEIASQESKSPSALAKKAPQFTGQVNEQFQSLLGRDASASEADYYGRLLATEELSPYEIEQYIKSGKEFQGGEDKKFRGELAGELGGYRDEAFDKAQESIISRQAKMTGPHKSSNLDFALAEASKDLQGETERYLTGISASQYGGNKATARADYENMLNQYLQGKDYSTKRSDSYADYLTQRADASVDYSQQMNDYLAFLSQQPKQKNNKLQSAFGGAAAGSNFGPWGAAGGAALGYLLA